MHNSRNTQKRCKICFKLTIKTQNDVSDVPSSAGIVNFKHIWFLFSNISIVNIEKVSASWEVVLPYLTFVFTIRNGNKWVENVFIVKVTPSLFFKIKASMF